MSKIISVTDKIRKRKGKPDPTRPAGSAVIKKINFTQAIGRAA